MSESIPAEVVDQLRRFNETLAVVEDALQCALSTPFEAYTQARTKQCMERLKEIEDRASAPRLNRRAASNFVRNALWEVPQRTPSVSSYYDICANLPCWEGLFVT
uniref:Nuclear nucleic acid-binding protein C1D n=1 Tax=Parascaris equorum TaxID=6256 RepID=A0A914RQW6_PAREQ